MKKATLLAVCTLFIMSSYCQGAWQLMQQMPDSVGGYNFTHNVCFVIDSTGYVYTGDSVNNFYAYSPASNTWSPKADFPGRPRWGAAGFATGGYGYVGSGSGNDWTGQYHDFYQYNPGSDSWTEKANYPDTVLGAYAFSVGDTGFFLGGALGLYQASTRCYAYLPASNQWVQKSNLPWSGQPFGFSAVLNGTPYCGLGQSLNVGFDKEFWAYNPATDIWTRRTDFPKNVTASIINHAPLLGFTIDSLIYVINDVWIFDSMYAFNPALNTWTSRSLYPSTIPEGTTGAYDDVSFSIGNGGFYGGFNDQYTYFWKYNPDAFFTASGLNPYNICSPGQVQVTINTNINFTNNYFTLMAIWQNDNLPLVISDTVPGNTSGVYYFNFPYSPPLGYLSNTYNIAVQATNPGYMSPYFISTLTVNQGAVVQNFGPTYITCPDQPVYVLIQMDSFTTETGYLSNGSRIVDSFTTNYQNGNRFALEPAQTTTYYYSSTASNTGCMYYDTFTVILLPVPPVTIIAKGDTLTTNNQYAAYQWYINDVPIAADTLATAMATSPGSYTVGVTDTNGCTIVSHAVITDISSIGAEGQIKVYPNPSSNGTWQVELSDLLVGSTCEIFDAEGKMVYRDYVESTKSLVSVHVSTGIYFMKISSAIGSYNIKLAAF